MKKFLFFEKVNKYILYCINFRSSLQEMKEKYMHKDFDSALYKVQQPGAKFCIIVTKTHTMSQKTSPRGKVRRGEVIRGIERRE